MKKIAIALVSLLLALTMVSCGSALDNAGKYIKAVDYTDGSVVSVKKSEIDKIVDEYVQSLLDAYPDKVPVTEGNIDYEYIITADYTAELKLLDQDISIKWEDSGISGFEKALKEATFDSNGTAIIEMDIGEVNKTFAIKFKDVTPTDEKNSSEPDEKSEEVKSSPEADENNENKEKSASAPQATAPILNDAANPEEKEPASAESKSENASESKKEEEPSPMHRMVVTLKDAKNVSDCKKDDTVKMHVLWTVPEYQNEKEAEIALPKKDGNSASPFPEEFAKKLVEEKVSVANDTEATITATYSKSYSAVTYIQNKDITYKLTVKKVIKNVPKDLETEKGFNDLKAECENTSDAFYYTTYSEMKEEQTKLATGSLAFTAIANATEMKKWPLDELAKYEARCRNAYSYAQQYGSFQYLSWFMSDGSLWANLFQQWGLTATKPLDSKTCTDIAGKVLRDNLVYAYLTKDIKEATDAEINAYIQKNIVDAKLLNSASGDKKEAYKSVEEVLEQTSKDYFISLIEQNNLYYKLAAAITVTDK